MLGQNLNQAQSSPHQLLSASGNPSRPTTPLSKIRGFPDKLSQNMPSPSAMAHFGYAPVPYIGDNGARSGSSSQASSSMGYHQPIPGPNQNSNPNDAGRVTTNAQLGGGGTPGGWAGIYGDGFSAGLSDLNDQGDGHKHHQSRSQSDGQVRFFPSGNADGPWSTLGPSHHGQGPMYPNAFPSTAEMPGQSSYTMGTAASQYVGPIAEGSAGIPSSIGQESLGLPQVSRPGSGNCKDEQLMSVLGRHVRY
jgi:hypothetical protein